MQQLSAAVQIPVKAEVSPGAASVGLPAFPVDQPGPPQRRDRPEHARPARTFVLSSIPSFSAILIGRLSKLKAPGKI